MAFRRKSFILIAIISALIIALASMLWQGRRIKKTAKILPGNYSSTIEYAEYRISQVMEEKHLPGFVVVLIDDQDIIWQDTFGLANLEKNQPTGLNTVFRLWSVAKVFTAFETMRLVEDELVDLDTPITVYIPDFTLQSRFPDSEPITVRNILTHRSGLPRNGCQRIEFNPNLLADQVTSLKNCYQTYPVGYRYKYSNIGFNLLGYLIEEMRGTPFPEYMRDELFLPIGMNNTTFLRSHLSAQAEVAPGYEYYEKEFYPYEQGDTTNIASGNLYSTVEDMGKFVKFIFRDGEANGKQLIAPDKFRMMFVEQASSPRDPHSMGLGWKTNRVLGSELLAWHDGGPSDGTGALVAFLPERKLGAVLIANGTTFDGSVSVPLAVELIGMMLETKYGLLVPPLEKLQETVNVERAILDDFVGKYIAFGELMDIYVQGGRLKGRVQGFTFNLNPLSETIYQPQHWLADIGLTSLLGAPVDLRQLKIEFMDGDDVSGDYMIIHLGGLNYEFCPEYPNLAEVPHLWKELSGDYELFAHLPTGLIGKEVLGQTRILVEDGVLQMAGLVGPILPINDKEIIVLSGSYAGETMVYDPETGNINHQGIVYMPLKRRE